MPGLLQTSTIMDFQSSLSSVLLMSSLLGDCFLVKKLLRLSVYFVRCLPLLLYHKSFYSIFAFLFRPLCSDPPKIVVIFFWWFRVGIFCTRPFLFIPGLTSFLLMYRISAASSLLSRSFVSVQHSHPSRRMDHM